jgi:hypothetical protein
MGALERAGIAIFKSPQLRDVLLYANLLLIFATAWVVYRWPDLAIPAVIVPFVLLSGEALLIYRVIKGSKTSATIDGDADGKQPE